jgi:hypothetical protein
VEAPYNITKVGWLNHVLYRVCPESWRSIAQEKRKLVCPLCETTQGTQHANNPADHSPNRLQLHLSATVAG